jgi:hypothetical protein
MPAWERELLIEELAKDEYGDEKGSGPAPDPFASVPPELQKLH